MGLFKNKYRVKSARWDGYDYSQDGYYFVTICTENKELFFGDVVNGEMVLSGIGEIAHKFWLEIPVHFPFAKLDHHVIMPNHAHGILLIDNGKKTTPVNTRNGAFQRTGQNEKPRPGNITMRVETRRGASLRTGQKTKNIEYKNKFGPLQKNSLSSIINHYKGDVTKLCQKYNFNFAWQSRFHDRVIRDENELNRARQYIIDNPLRWHLDRNNKNDLYI